MTALRKADYERQIAVLAQENDSLRRALSEEIIGRMPQFDKSWAASTQEAWYAAFKAASNLVPAKE